MTSKILQIPLVKNTLKLSSSHAVLMFLPLFVTPILSRLYTPADYGDWGMFSSVFYVINSFLFLSYENAIVKTNKAEEVPIILCLCSIVALLVIIVTYVVFILGTNMGIPFFLRFPSIQLLLILLLVQAVHTLGNNVANREGKYGIMSFAGILGGFSQAFFRVLFGFFPIIIYGLIVGNLIAQFITTLFLLFCIIRKIKLNWKSVTMFKICEIAKSNRKFPLFDAPARFVELSISNIALLIMSLFWAKEDIGCYSMVYQFILLPISIIGSSMGNVFYREISENVENKTKVSQTTNRACKITFVLSFLPLLFFVMGGDKLLVVFLGEKWGTAGNIALCMSVMSVPLILSEPLLPIFRSLNKQEIRLRLNIVYFVIPLGVLLISALIYSNLYISLLLYSFLSGLVRYWMFYTVTKLANVSIKSINRHFYIISFGLYMLLALRIFYAFSSC